MKKNNRPQITATFPEEVYERLCTESDALGITRSAYITMVLKQRWQSEELAQNFPAFISAIGKMTDTAERIESNRKASK